MIKTKTLLYSLFYSSYQRIKDEMAAQGASLLMIEYPAGPKTAVETSEDNLVQLREAENMVADMKEDLANTPKANRAAVTAMKHKVIDAEDEMEKSKQKFIEGIINLLCLAEVVPLINSGFNRIVRIRMIEIRLAREQRAVAREAQQQLQIRTDRRAQLSRRSLKLRLEQLQQRSAQKRPLEQQTDEQPVVKRARQDNASPVMQYDGADVECEVSLEQDPVATDFGAVGTQQVDTFPLKIETFSGFFF